MTIQLNEELAQNGENESIIEFDEQDPCLSCSHRWNSKLVFPALYSDVIIAAITSIAETPAITDIPTNMMITTKDYSK